VTATRFYSHDSTGFDISELLAWAGGAAALRSAPPSHRTPTARLLRCLLLTLGAALLLTAVDAAPDSLTEHILARGAAFHGTNGLAFDSRDRLHVASVAGREIIIIDPGNGAILDRLGPDRGVEGPDGIAVRTDGSVYLTSFFTGEVVRISPQGGRLGSQFIASGVNPIAFSADGRLFVGAFFFGSGLFELDPELAAAPRVVIPPGDPVEGVNGMDFGPDGLLYAPQPFLGRVVRLDVDESPPVLNVVAGGFLNPIALTFDSAGRLHVVDATAGTIVRVDTNTGDTAQIAALRPGLDNLAFDSRDRLFVSSSWDGFIAHVLPGGEVRVLSRGGMIVPGGVAVLRAMAPSPGQPAFDRDAVFVADAFKIREFDGLSGASRRETQVALNAQTVAPDGGRLIVSSWFGNAVYVFDPASGTVVEQFPEFPVPLNAVRFRDNLVVADVGTGIPRVVLRDPSGELSVLAQADNRSIFLPAGLAADGEGLWFADWGSGVVWQLASGGSLMPPQPVAFGLVQPEGLALRQRGKLLAVEAGAGKLSEIDLESGNVRTIVEGLAVGAPPVPGTPPTWAFNGVAVGPSGAVYVSSDIENLIYRFHLRPAKRGDANLDGRIDVNDAIAIIAAQFLGRGRIQCLEAADFNGSGAVDLSDAIAILQYLFHGSPTGEAQELICR
jgi:sugar lactone lactonase YvrE